MIPLASARRRLAPAFSFKRVAMKSTLLPSTARMLSKEIHESGMEYSKPSMTIEETDFGVGKYNKGKRYI